MKNLIWRPKLFSYQMTPIIIINLGPCRSSCTGEDDPRTSSCTGGDDPRTWSRLLLLQDFIPFDERHITKLCMVFTNDVIKCEKLRTTDATKAFNKPWAATMQVERGHATMKIGVYKRLEIFERLSNVSFSGIRNWTIGRLVESKIVWMCTCCTSKLGLAIGNGKFGDFWHLS